MAGAEKLIDRVNISSLIAQPGVESPSTRMFFLDGKSIGVDFINQ
tara:strand:- start:718 stop:852 length:135 start_codon:yes stop_codon:yes gene_type:complete